MAIEHAIVGLIRKAHGIRGEVTVELVTDEPERLFAPGARLIAGTADGDPAVPRRPGDPGSSELIVQHSSPFHDGLIVKFDIIPDRDTAERWRGRYLLVPADELTPPGEGEVFVHDLIGMRVVQEDGGELGSVVAFYELPQGLTLEVKRESGDVLLPYRAEVVREVDLDTRTIVVADSSGLFE